MSGTTQDNEEQPHIGAVDLTDISLSYAEWRPKLRGQGPTLLFVHATGFHGRVWDRIVRALPGRHVVCVDQRGHGLSSDGGADHWRVYCRDLIEFVEALDLSRLVGIGHSMGGHVLTAAAARDPDRYRRLILIDPVIAAPECYAPSRRLEANPMVLRRKRHFRSPEEMFERFRTRDPYRLFDEGVLWDYCRFGLKTAVDETGYVLACAPETEDGIYQASFSHGDIYKAVRSLHLPVVIVRAQMMESVEHLDFTKSLTWPNLAAEFPSARDIFRPDLTHLMPMQDPATFVELISSETLAD